MGIILIYQYNKIIANITHGINLHDTSTKKYKSNKLNSENFCFTFAKSRFKTEEGTIFSIFS
jgi:hypothetical protein